MCTIVSDSDSDAPEFTPLVSLLTYIAQYDLQRGLGKGINIYNYTYISLQPQRFCLQQSSDSTVTLYPATTLTEVLKSKA